MNVVLLLLTSGFCYGVTEVSVVPKVISRWKRDAVGALEIVTNNASPIHADVNAEKPQDSPKPCPQKSEPSKIEPGVVFQIVPPKDTFQVKSLRKSFPLTSHLDLVRCINRIIAIAAIIFAAAVEIYPVVVSIYDLVFSYKY